MRNTVFFFAVMLCVTSSLAQLPPEPWLRGYDDYTKGEIIGYNNALKGHGPALLVRSLDEKKYIEWQTAPVPEKADGDKLVFVWLAGYDNVKTPRKFKMYLNGKHYFTFTGKRAQEWKVNGPKGAALQFVNRIMDQHNDYQGYHFLIVPAELFPKGKPITIRVAGESKGEYTWYMAFMDKLKPSVNVVNEQALVREGDSLVQRIRIEMIHHGWPKKVAVLLQGRGDRQETINLGKNTVYFPLKQVTEKKDMTLSIAIEGKAPETHKVTVKPVRKFTIYFLPHSHVDIGYTHTQAQVEQMQWDNFEKAMALAEKTAGYPEGARFKWNTEIFWPVDGYLRNASEENRRKFMEAVNAGILHPEALYGDNLTGIMRPEELFRLAGENVRPLKKEFGINIKTAMITDVSGYSWGIIPALAHNGVKYFSSGPNHIMALPHGGDRIGYTLEAWGDRPFYWESPSGQHKVLFWVTAHGYSWFHGGNIGEIQKAGSAPILSYLDELDEEGYPYDMLYLRYTIGGDNGPPDPGLPDFIRDWNKEYEWPKMRIATTLELFEDFESKYADQLPVLRGDFTPYWEDGAASSARETVLNRNAVDKLVKAEILWSLLMKKEAFPHNRFYEGWKNAILFSEHTWGANISVSDPDSEFTKELWRVKKKMATDADSIANILLEDLIVARGPAKGITVINTTSWAHDELVKVPSRWLDGYNAVKDDEGELLPSQILNDGSLAFIAEKVPALGVRHYQLEKGQSPNVEVEGDIDEHKMTNGIITVKIDPVTGALTHLSRYEDGIDLIDESADYPTNTYIYTGINATNPKVSKNPVISITEQGPLVWEWTIDYEAPGAKWLKTTIQLHTGSDVVHITNSMDKLDVREKENVRFAFPFNVDCGEMVMDLAWAKMKPEVDQLEGANKNFFSIQRWIDVSNEDHGITWVTPDAPLVEIGGMYGEAWMKSPDRPWIRHHEPSQKIFSWVMNNSWHTNYKASQSGPATFRYMIRPHKGGLDYGDAKRLGVEVSRPFVVAMGKRQIINDILKPEKQDVIITSIRPDSENNGFLIRLFNATDKFGILNLAKWNTNGHKIYLVDTDGNKSDELTKNLYFGAWEIKAIYVED